MSVVAAPTAITRRLAERALAVAAADLAERTLEHAKQAVLDSIGVAVRARFESETSAALQRVAAALGSAGTCTAIGYGAAFSAPFAALSNACNIHVLDFDDTHERSSLHPGAPVIGASLAAAETCAAGG